ncbi:MAG: ABC transporter permease [Armatimonadetes bacterium]|nr:ABC transporter permease [Armatimonadota bacterium]
MRGLLFWGSVVFLALLLLFAVFGPQIRHGPFEIVGSPYIKPSADAWLGTDEQGRDIFSRLAYGARVSLLIGLSVVTVGILVALIVGTGAGYGAPWLNTVLMRFTDGMFAFPDILLAILIVGIVGPSFWAVFGALAVIAWPSMARLLRNQVLSLKEQEFVTASRALGAGHWHVVFKHILPHLVGLISAVAMVEVAMIILAESSLSFLGIGVQPPTPSWGSMINTARTVMRSDILPLLWPCLILSLTILALNFVGDGLRDRFDPKSAAGG